MEKALAIWVDKSYRQDVLFDEFGHLNRDDCLSPFRALKSEMKNAGWTVHTHDYFLSINAAPTSVLFLDIPKKNVNYMLRKCGWSVNKYVLLQECEIIKPDNWDLSRHREFDIIFTWDDKLVDSKKYIKVNFSVNFNRALHGTPVKEKLCTLIAANKKRNHPLELYSKRIEAIKWFETNHPDDFDFYGVGWDKFTISEIKILRILNRSKLITNMFVKKHPCYKGVVSSKLETLSKYKYCICYENAHDIESYITEKIFDCFMAKTVPIYWGANNILNYIPEKCFINLEKYKTYSDLYNKISNITNDEYLLYLDNIETLLNSSAIEPFSSANFAKVISGTILSGA